MVILKYNALKVKTQKQITKIPNMEEPIWTKAEAVEKLWYQMLY
jgi:hypothetical protein